MSLTAIPGDRPTRRPVCGSAAPDADADADADGLAGPAAEQAGCPHCGHLLWFASNRRGDVTVVHVMDTQLAVMELLDLLDNAVGEGLVESLLLDCRNIQQVSSAVLGKLLKLKNHAESVRGRLKLCRLHEDLRQVFRITHLDHHFAIHDDEAEALAAFGAGTF